MGTAPATRSRRRSSPGASQATACPSRPCGRPPPPGDFEDLEPHMAIRIAVREPDERPGGERLHPDLLAQLAFERGARGLARLQLPAGELPLPGEVAAGEAPGREHPAVGPAKDAHRDVDRRPGRAARGRAICRSGGHLRL